MDSSEDVYSVELMLSSRRSDSSFKLYDNQMMVGAAEVKVPWWQRRSSGIVVVASIAWLFFECSGLSFLSVCCDILLIIVVMLFLRANYTGFKNNQLEAVPELVLSEEMVNSAAASFRVEINRMIVMAHDITLGNNFKHFFKVVLSLWLLSVIGSLVSFPTLAFIGIILRTTLPVLRNMYIYFPKEENEDNGVVFFFLEEKHLYCVFN
ncbi:hypothetical protein Leryth_018062 [Lithospermum erythrorhizon]|uniref:Reticulon-like protein n=1 Tax=Lithospermum erythrorhizon TaxID=34254 RepID=A0AAV3QIZ5_LITER|nr:hypothetical protein Leryth_018062 [Lithospermum erythrorhizon]